jgi:cobalt-zinc-cadmium efflux system membrane fusion protein
MRGPNHKLLLVLTIAGLLGCSKNAKIVVDTIPQPRIDTEKAVVSFPADAPQLSSITVQPAEARTLSVSHATGRLYWDDDVTVRVFTPVAGRVTALKADIGQHVEKDGALAELDSPDFGQALASARTAVGNLAAADEAYARSKGLLEHGAAAERDVEAARAADVAAIAERDRAEAVLADYGGSDKDTNSVYLLRSPLAGDVVERNVTIGQELRADLMLANAPNLFAPAFVVSDPTKLWLQIDVPETGLTSVRTGERLKVTSVALPGMEFEGVVDNIADSMDPSTRTIKVRGTVHNPDRLLKAEMYVTVDVASQPDIRNPAGVEVSSKALFMKGNDSFLFVEDAPGRFQRKQVKVGVEQDNKVPVLEGLNPGEKVVTEGALLLQALVEPES